MAFLSPLLLRIIHCKAMVPEESNALVNVFFFFSFPFPFNVQDEYGDVAQMEERSLCMREVQGSIPCISIYLCRYIFRHSHRIKSDISDSFCYNKAVTVTRNCRRDRLVVRTLCCGRSNPGSNPGLGISHVVPYCLVVRIPGSHPGGPGSIPGMGSYNICQPY